jgi:hypothetical protein
MSTSKSWPKRLIRTTRLFPIPTNSMMQNSTIGPLIRCWAMRRKTWLRGQSDWSVW